MSSPPKPGERKILQSLTTGDKPFKDLREQCVKNPNILSFYLKNLQKYGFIIRDIDTRKFKLIGRGWETLYLADIRDVITEFGFRKANTKLLGLDVIVSESTGVLEFADDMLGEANARNVLSTFAKINKFIFYAWRNRLLSLFGEKERETIVKYEDTFEEAVWFVIPPGERVDEASFRIRAEERLVRRYPGVEIHEKMIQLEASRIAKKTEEREKKMLAMEIGTVEGLRNRLLEATHLTEEEQAKLNPLLEYLQDSENIEVHARFLKKLKECPKTLMVFSSTGFSGYLRKQWQFFPKEEQAFKKRHPWLYAKIKESC
jgi:hypothetical protein